MFRRVFIMKWSHQQIVNEITIGNLITRRLNLSISHILVWAQMVRATLKWVQKCMVWPWVHTLMSINFTVIIHICRRQVPVKTASPYLFTNPSHFSWNVWHSWNETDRITTEIATNLKAEAKNGMLYILWLAELATVTGHVDSKHCIPCSPVCTALHPHSWGMAGLATHLPTLGNLYTYTHDCSQIIRNSMYSFRIAQRRQLSTEVEKVIWLSGEFCEKRQFCGRSPFHEIP